MSLLHVIMVILPALAVGQSIHDFKPYNLTATAMFLQLDTDLSGDIDRPELDASFRKYDADQNGRISRSEYTNYVDQFLPSLHDVHDALFNLYDVDNDHILDHHDFDNFFSLMDGNGNGSVTHFEFVRYWTILLQDLETYNADV